jgi:hypothetical protein
MNTMKAISLIFGLLVLPAMLYNEKAIEINGTVVNADEGTPLVDSHVYVKGTHIGVVTGQNGEFSLRVPLIYQNKPLIVSYVGFASFEEKVSKVRQKNVRIAMKPGVYALEELVVTPGKEILVDQAIDMVLAEYDDEEEMLEDFYAALFYYDQEQRVLHSLLDEESIETN